MRLHVGVLFPNIPMSLQTSATGAHLAEGQFLLEEQVVDVAESLVYQAESRTLEASRRGVQNL